MPYFCEFSPSSKIYYYLLAGHLFTKFTVLSIQTSIIHTIKSITLWKTQQTDDNYVPPLFTEILLGMLTDVPDLLRESRESNCHPSILPYNNGVSSTRLLSVLSVFHQFQYSIVRSQGSALRILQAWGHQMWPQSPLVRQNCH